MEVKKLPTLPTLPKKKQVAAYVRVSSGKDAMLHSLSAQVSYYSAYIQKQPEWLYCGVYVDESRSTGELQASLGVSPMHIDKNGNADVKIGFREPRSQQTAAKGKRSYSQITNAMIANVLEYGRKGQAPKPFLAPAKKASKKDTTAKMEAVLREEIDKL